MRIPPWMLPTRDRQGIGTCPELCGGWTSPRRRCGDRGFQGLIDHGPFRRVGLFLHRLHGPLIDNQEAPQRIQLPRASLKCKITRRTEPACLTKTLAPAPLPAGVPTTILQHMSASAGMTGAALRNGSREGQFCVSGGPASDPFVPWPPRRPSGPLSGPSQPPAVAGTSVAIGNTPITLNGPG